MASNLTGWEQPLLDTELIGARQDAVEALCADGALRASLQQELLRGLPDVQRLLLRLNRVGKVSNNK